MKPSTKTSAWLPALAACTALLGCQERVIDPDREAGGSDEIDTRMAMDAKGRPLAGARIALVSAGDSTGKLAALSSTGSNGQYPSFNVPDGPYSATLRDAQDSLGKFLDTLQITGGKAKVGRDTLLALGKIRGVVRLVGGEAPTGVIMSLYGTDIAANVRKDGSFEIDLVPGGLFTLMGSTSLDGYGTLLRRLQLRDGQDLIIPDTLSLPVTGLLAPANLWVESDTATGDVRVRWNKVDHPNRMGYMLEKVENGAVTRSQFLTDTVWMDSMNGYWEGLPLLGPWPAREAVYRVRTRSLNGAGDTRSVAQSIVAKAPEWTRRVDSVRLTMTTDTLADVSSLRWKSPPHPDLKGWYVQRTVNGQMDCSMELTGNSWSDDRCRATRKVVLDSTQPGTGNPVLRLEGEFAREIKYQLRSIRKLGRAEEVGTVQRNVLGDNLITWRDSGLTGIPQSTILRTVGKWVLWQTSNAVRPIVSRDGQNWEIVPIQGGGAGTYYVDVYAIFNVGDTLVYLTRDYEKGLKTFVLQSPGVWSERIYKTDSAIDYVPWVSKHRGWPVVEGSWYYMKRPIPKEGPVAAKYALMGDTSIILGQFLVANGSAAGFSDFGIELPWIVDRPQWFEWKDDNNRDFTTFILRDSSSVIQEWCYKWEIGHDGFIGAGDLRDGFFAYHTNPKDFGIVYMSRNSPPKLVNPPVLGISFAPEYDHYAVVGEEIWVIMNGRLWKGKLNLPKGQ